ncbi:MAG: hypothetical protein RLZZ13_452 [Pseudomonadota bacterium]|jgi:hypothetical protein
MKTGVNKNGVRWIQDGKKTTAFYQLSSDVELSKTFENATRQKIDRLTGTELLKNESAKK